jgi:hypothetical protein
MNYQLPVTAGLYEFPVVGAGNRPPGSEPTRYTFWMDGEMARFAAAAMLGRR